MLDSRSNIGRSTSVILILFALWTVPSACYAQNRVDLDELAIKGELLNDNRLRMSARDQHKITDRVTYRDNFRREIVDGLEIPWPDQEGASRGTASQGTGGAQ